MFNVYNIPTKLSEEQMEGGWGKGGEREEGGRENRDNNYVK